MARWKVNSKHYIHAEQYGQPTEYVREETNRDTGRTFRKALVVPMLIDPEDPSCINRFNGMCVVATEGSEQPGDIVFFGPPTMEMEPLDDEARKITEAEQHKWVSPIDGLPAQVGEDFAAVLLRGLESQLNAARSQPQEAVLLKSVSNSEVADLKALLAAQQEQINKLLGSAPQPDVDLSEPEPKAPPPVAARPHTTQPSLRR